MWLFIAACLSLISILYIRIFNPELFKIIRYHFKIHTIHFLCLLTTLLSLPALLVRGKHHSNTQFLAKFLTYTPKIMGVQWRLRNTEILSKDEGAVVILNHQTILDFLGASNFLDRVPKIAVVAKKSLLYAGPFGLAGYLCDLIFLDRSNPKNSYKTLETTAHMIAKRKVKILMFPEGTRNEDKTEKLLPFKKGAFVTAVTAQAPIIPVVFSPYTFIDKRTYKFDRGYVIIKVLQPVPTVGLTLEDVPALMERLHSIMLHAYNELTEEVMDNLPAEERKMQKL